METWNKCGLCSKRIRINIPAGASISLPVWATRTLWNYETMKIGLPRTLWVWFVATILVLQISLAYDGHSSLAAKTGIPRNAAVFEIETQGGMLTRDGRILQSGAVKSRTDFLNQTPVRRVDFDHAHGNLGAPHVNPLHVNPNNPSLINAGRPRLPEPGEYLSPVLSDPRIQGGVFRP